MTQPRYLAKPVFEDCLKQRKMAFVTGPRQVGKTVLSKLVQKEFQHSAYFNWDDKDFKKMWIQNPKSIFENTKDQTLIILDEIHKSSKWKNTLKGLYDLYQEHYYFLVTGSAHLNTFRRGGDSLLGRHFLFHLHPYSLGELEGNEKNTPQDLIDFLASPLAKTPASSIKLFENLLHFGGFPDPFQKQQTRYLQMWRQSRLEKMLQEDLRDLTRILEIHRLETLASLLPPRVGSLFSLKNLAEDIEISQPTVKIWLKYLEALFYQYTLRPYSKNIARSLKKDSKMFLWDWSELEDKGKITENILAGALLKACHFWTDFGYGKFKLHFYRDKEKREVDFVLTQKDEPWMLIEAKSGQKSISKSLYYLKQKFPKAHGIQLIQENNFYRQDPESKIHVLSLVNFLRQLV